MTKQPTCWKRNFHQEFRMARGQPGIGGFNHVTTIQVCHTNDKRLWLCGYYWVVFGILTYLRSSYQTIGRNYASLAKPWRDLKQLMIASISFKSLETRSFTHGQWFVEIPSFRELKSGWIRWLLNIYQLYGFFCLQAVPSSNQFWELRKSGSLVMRWEVGGFFFHHVCSMVLFFVIIAFNNMNTEYS